MDRCSEADYRSRKNPAQINLKREKELQNIKDAIDYMENNYSEIDDMLDKLSEFDQYLF